MSELSKQYDDYMCVFDIENYSLTSHNTTTGGAFSGSRRDTFSTGPGDRASVYDDETSDIGSSEDSEEDSADEGETQPIEPPRSIICTELLPNPPSGTWSFAVLSRRMWTVGSTVKISFKRPEDDVLSRENFDFNTVVARVKTYARIWLRYANLSFKFIDGPFEEGQIRITFRPGLGHYSYVGIPSVDRSEPTMNFDPDEITTTIDLRRFRGIVLHEFGHALGCIHEYAQPNAAIDWNEPFVLDFYKTRYGWDENTTRKIILKKYAPCFEEDEPIEPTEFNSKSIMQYDIGSDFTKDGKAYAVRSKLFLGDKRVIEQWYPREPCNAGTFTIRAKVPKQPNTPMLAPLPSDTVEEMRKGRRLRKVVLGVTRVATDRSLNLRSDFNASHLSDLSKPLSLCGVPQDSGGDTIHRGSWLSLATSGPDVQSGHLTISVKDSRLRKIVQTFSNPYPPGEVPHVVVWLHSIESTPKDRRKISHYFDVSPANPSNTSFQILYIGSPTCKLGVSWLSYSAMRHDLRSGSCSYENPDGQKNRGSFDMKLDGERFSRSVKLFVAFSGISTLGGNASVSIDVPRDTGTPRGMTFSIRPSKETSLSNATVTYVVIDRDKVSMNRYGHPDIDLYGSRGLQ